MFKLVISDDEGKTTVVPLVRDEVSIGRKEGNTIRLTERNVSRRHARLRKANGVYVIEDLNSYNGVKINGCRIEGERPLTEGDQIAIGDYTLALKSDAGAGVEAPAASAAAGAAPIPPARLVMLTPPAPGAEFALTRSGMRIGRAEDLDVWINHRSISREHAEVRLEGDLIKVVDLGSANGVRLNGEDVREATLSSGDVLELGQVRFRYVSAGEAYVFEADRTVQMDALQLPDEPTNGRVPLIAAAVIVLVAIGVGAAIALSGGESPPDDGDAVSFAEPAPGTAPPDPQPPSATESPVDPSAAAIPLVERCRQALEGGDFEGAQAAASRALELAPNHEAATECARDAQAAAQLQATFDRGVEALEAERYDEAYFAFEELPEDSPLRSRPEVQLARDRFAGFSLERARESLDRGDRGMAISYANNVLAVSDLPQHLESAASEILRRARGTSGGGRPRGRRAGRNGGGAMTMDEVRASSSPSPMESPMAASVDPRTVMRDCSYNQRCVAQRLAGRANTPAAMGVLIEAYKAIGDSGAARRTMQQLIRRFPNSRQANQYRRQL